ncbi:hypothetical protein NXW13_00660 [Bacteroides thetaiotaomicron]|nr:hypothetical protein [Bacteroides thetaiotaomicron]
MARAWRNMATIKIYVGAAGRGGYMEQDLFSAIKIRRPKSEVVYLTEEELLRLTALYRSGRLEECTPNLPVFFFLFLCFTLFAYRRCKRTANKPVHREQITGYYTAEVRPKYR